MKELEKQYKALANSKRLSILKYLKSTRQASVGDIADKIGLTLKATSKHLRILHDINALERSKQSLAVYYRLAERLQPAVKQLIKLI